MALTSPGSHTPAMGDPNCRDLFHMITSSLMDSRGLSPIADVLHPPPKKEREDTPWVLL